MERLSGAQASRLGRSAEMSAWGDVNSKGHFRIPPPIERVRSKKTPRPGLHFPGGQIARKRAAGEIEVRFNAPDAKGPKLNRKLANLRDATGLQYKTGECYGRVTLEGRRASPLDLGESP
jgi:hypothetical protein